MVKIYKQPFAHGGDTIAIPDASQPDGKMSNDDGWTPDYQLPKTDPNYKPVGRQEMNGVFKEVTEALGQVQVQGSATWSADGAPYPINAQVYHNGKQWIALRANSVEPVEGEDWSAIGTAATKDVGTSSGNVMEVGAFGLGATNAPGGFHDNADLLTTAGFYVVTGPAVGGQEGTDGGLFTMVGGSDTKQLGWDTPGSLRFRGNDNPEEAPEGWTDWLEIIHSGNLLASMQPSMTGSATLNGTTGNTVQLTNIVTALGLEVGDVIRIQYSGYNKLHTVESITNNNLIVVNYEHAGNRGNGSLKLANRTGSVTIKRIAKWYNAPTGMGQAWVDLTGFRVGNTNYTNATKRAIMVFARLGNAANQSAFIEVDGVIASSTANQVSSASTSAGASALVNAGGVYKSYAGVGSQAVVSWSELR